MAEPTNDGARTFSRCIRYARIVSKRILRALWQQRKRITSMETTQTSTRRMGGDSASPITREERRHHDAHSGEASVPAKAFDTNGVQKAIAFWLDTGTAGSRARPRLLLGGVMAESWIQFDEVEAGPPKRKTKLWLVNSKEVSCGALGQVKFYPRWRKYAFFPFESTLFEQNCLRDIANFCEQQTRAWRATI